MTSRPVVAVMQPYFYPYLGYFRLLAQADVFVLLDDVQFPRRGRVHRCQVPSPKGGVEWLTLPLRRAPVGTRIVDMAFHADADAMWRARLLRHPWFGKGDAPAADEVRAQVLGALTTPDAFVSDGIELTARLLGLRTPVLRSSSMKLDPALRGADHLIDIVRAVGGRTYLNAPGGRELYEPAAFAARDVQLEFLPPYQGRFWRLLPALLGEDVRTLKADLGLD